MLIYTENSNQNIHLGMTSNSKSMLVINSNSTLFNASNVIVQSNLIINGLLTLSNIEYVTNNLTIYNSATIQNDLSVFDVATLCNTVNIYGDTTISNVVSTLITTGLTTSHSNAVNISGSTTLSNGLITYNNGTTVLSNNVNIYGTTTLSNNLILTSNVAIGKTMPSVPITTLDLAGSLQVSSNIITLGYSNRIWDFSGTISDTSKTPGYISSSYISGSNITVSSNKAFSNINTEGSIYLPGITGNCITLPQPTTSALPDTTIECWIYQTANPLSANGSTPYLIGNMASNVSTNYWSFGINNNNQLAFYGYIGTTATNVTAATINNNTWNHIAMCYSNASKTFYMFLNGTLQTLTASGSVTGSGTTAVTITTGVAYNSAMPLIIGQYYGVPISNTYISNLRWTNSVLYTANFTPSRYPLQSTSNTQLLLRAPLYNPITNTNAVHTYDSMRVHSLPSDAMIYADCYGTNLPNLSGQYTPVFDSNITKSIVFNSVNSNYLSFPPQTFNIATKGFTLISKCMFTGAPGSYERIFEVGNGANNNNIGLQRNSTTSQLTLFFGSNNGNAQNFLTPAVLNQNTIFTCVARYDPYTNGGTSTIFYNGSNIYSSNAMSGALGTDRTVNNIFIGNNEWGNITLNGNIYNLAVYNRALTDKEIQDATAALMAEPSLPNKSTIEIGNANGNPALSVKQDGTLQIAGPITTTNNQSYAPVDYGISNLSIPGSIVGTVPAVAMSPFNASSATDGSLYLSGTTGNYITLPQPASGALPDTTIEAWIYLPVTPSNVHNGYNMPILIGNQTPGSQVTYWSFGVNSLNNLSFFNLGSNYASAPLTTINNSNWYHIAFCYSNSPKTMQMFVNGALQTLSTAGLNTTGSNTTTATFSTSVSYNSAAPLTIGQNTNAALNAYVTNLRWTNSVLYTASFTPPTAPLPPSSTGTTALLLRVPQNPGRVLIPKIGGTTQVQAYPPAAMTANLTNIQNTAYGAGTYIATASTYSLYTTIGYPYNAFANTASLYWQSGTTYTSATGLYSGSVTTVDISGNTYLGEWLQIQMPNSIILQSYTLYNNSSYGQNPSTFSLLGSVDGRSWNIVSQQTNNTSYTITLNVNITKAFSYYRLVVSKNASWAWTGYAQDKVSTNLILYGTQESISISPDGQVGLGVTRPTQQLEVAGNAIISGNISANNMGMFRNRIINGDMRIDQRNNGAIATNITGGYSSVDRFCFNNSVGGTFSVQRIALTSSDTPYQNGFQNAIKLITTTSNNSSGGTQTAWGQFIENINVSDFQWGTQYAVPATISFWCKTNFTGIVGTSILPEWTTGVGGEYYRQTSFTSNAWQYVRFVIPPPTSLTISSTLKTLQIYIGSYTGGINKTNNAWQSPLYVGAGDGTWCTTIGNSLTITGVQLEKGTIATPFEIRPYPVELDLCQRYFYIYASTTSANYDPIGIGYTEANQGVVTVKHPIEMRATPSLYTSGNTTTGIFQTMLSGGVMTNFNCTSIGTVGSSKVSSLTFPASGLPVGVANNIRFSNTATPGAIGFNAEL
jgi:hypothetical protein